MDPLAEKYYSISPYAYVANNPLRYIDPTGMDIWEINSRGEIEWKERSDDHRLYSLDNKGNRSSDNYITVGDRSILDNLSGKFKDGKNVYTVTSNGNDARNVFYFASDNSTMEWGLQGYKSNGTLQFVLGTSHKDWYVQTTKMSQQAGFSLENLWLDAHSHPAPDGTKGGSGVYNGEKSW